VPHVTLRGRGSDERAGGWIDSTAWYAGRFEQAVGQVRAIVWA
jgi:hypothetical protein